MTVMTHEDQIRELRRFVAQADAGRPWALDEECEPTHARVFLPLTTDFQWKLALFPKDGGQWQGYCHAGGQETGLYGTFPQVVRWLGVRHAEWARFRAAGDAVREQARSPYWALSERGRQGRVLALRIFEFPEVTESRVRLFMAATGDRRLGGELHGSVRLPFTAGPEDEIYGDDAEVSAWLREWGLTLQVPAMLRGCADRRAPHDIVDNLSPKRLARLTVLLSLTGSGNGNRCRQALLDTFAGDV